MLTSFLGPEGAAQLGRLQDLGGLEAFGGKSGRLSGQLGGDVQRRAGYIGVPDPGLGCTGLSGSRARIDPGLYPTDL